MLHRVAWMQVAVVMLMIRGMQMETLTVEGARTTRPLAQSRHLKQWLPSPKAAASGALTRGPTRPGGDGARAGRTRVRPDGAAPDRRGNILEVITALEELHRAVDGSLDARITMRPRAHGRNSGRKNKAALAADAQRFATSAPAAAAAAESTRASTDAAVPGLTGRNFRKSLAPQAKKANKRVCFWKYCSQN